MVLPMVTESSAGRMETVTLLPLSQSEIYRETANWLNSVKENDLKGIRRLAKAAGERWICGIILYDGDMTLPLGRNIWSAPLSTLWGRKSRKID